MFALKKSLILTLFIYIKREKEREKKVSTLHVPYDTLTAIWHRILAKFGQFIFKIAAMVLRPIILLAESTQSVRIKISNLFCYANIWSGVHPNCASR